MKNELIVAFVLVFLIASTANALTCEQQISRLINMSCITDNEPILTVKAAEEIPCFVTPWTKVEQIALMVNSSFHGEGKLDASPEEVAKKFRQFGLNETGRATTYQKQTITVISRGKVNRVPINGGRTFLTVASDIINDDPVIRLINFDYRNGILKHDCDGWAKRSDLGTPIELIKIKVTEIKNV